MATDRNKKRVKRIRDRSRYRKVVNRIHKISRKLVAGEDNSPNHWNEVVKHLTCGEIEIGLEYSSRHELLGYMHDALETALTEKIIGLTS